MAKENKNNRYVVVGLKKLIYAHTLKYFVIWTDM